MSKDQGPSIDNIINQLKTDLNNEVEFGPFTLKELSYEQQRKLLNNHTSFAESAALINNVLNDFIGENVQYADDVADVRKTVTIIQKPFLLTQLRIMSYGDVYTDEGINYKIHQATDEELTQTIEPKTITRGGLKINLRVPTLDVDTHFNQILIQALSNYKNRQSRSITETESADLMFKYNLYESMKYIESFEFNGQTFTMTDMMPRSCVDFMNVLKASIMREIAAYQEEVEKLILPANKIYNEETAEESEVSNVIVYFVQDLDGIMFNSMI